MKVIKWLAIGFFGAIVATIVFVKAGSSGQTGGQQTAEIVTGSGTALANVATALEGG
jgi:hypothetical protein